VYGAELHTCICTQHADNAFSGRSVCKWIEMFKKGWTSLTVAGSSGCPSILSSSEKLIEARAMVLKDRRVTVTEITHRLSISQG
jgi:hypothetical protein